MSLPVSPVSPLDLSQLAAPAAVLKRVPLLTPDQHVLLQAVLEVVVANRQDEADPRRAGNLARLVELQGLIEQAQEVRL